MSCSHQDESDVKHHVEGPIHQKKLKDLKSIKRLSNFGFRKQDDTLKEQVTHEFLQPRLYGAVCKCLAHTHTQTQTIIITMCE